MGMTRKVEIFKRAHSIFFQVLRLGRPIGIIKSVFILFRSLTKKEGKTEAIQGFTYTYFKALAEISLALFFLFDHVLYLGRVYFLFECGEIILIQLKIVKNQNLLQRCDYLSNFFWLCECFATIISDCMQIHVLQNKLAQEVLKFTIMKINFQLQSLARQKTAQEINDIKEKIDNSILNIIRSIIDTPVYLYFFNLLNSLQVALHFMNPKFLDPAFVGVLGAITSLIGCYQAWPKKQV